MTEITGLWISINKVFNIWSHDIYTLYIKIEGVYFKDFIDRNSEAFAEFFFLRDNNLWTAQKIYKYKLCYNYDLTT